LAVRASGEVGRVLVARTLELSQELDPVRERGSPRGLLLDGVACPLLLRRGLRERATRDN
jgi:hypothetical protein